VATSRTIEVQRIGKQLKDEEPEFYESHPHYQNSSAVYRVVRQGDHIE
jgi:hypothetical protein